MTSIPTLVNEIAQLKTPNERNLSIDTFAGQGGLYSERMGDEDRDSLRDSLSTGGFEAMAANDVGLYRYFNAKICEDQFWRPANEQRGQGAWFRWRDFAAIKDELDEIKKKISVSPFMSHYLDGVVAHLANNFEEACVSFRKAAQIETGPKSFLGIHTVPNYDLVWDLPDLSAPDLIEDKHFSLVYGKMPGRKGISPDLVFACDSIYFDTYFAQVTQSLRNARGLSRWVNNDSHRSRWIANRMGIGGSFNVLIAVYGAHRVKSLAKTVEEMQRALPHAKVSIFSIDTQPLSVADMPAFFTAMRFYFLRYLLRLGRQRLLCYDIDIEFNNKYQWNLDQLLNEFDVGVFVNRGARSSVPWRVINASSFAIKKKFWAEYYLDLILSYLNHQLPSLSRGWFVDQQALFWGRHFCMRAAPGVRIGNIGDFGPQFKTRKLLPT